MRVPNAANITNKLSPLAIQPVVGYRLLVTTMLVTTTKNDYCYESRLRAILWCLTTALSIDERSTPVLANFWPIFGSGPAAKLMTLR